MSNGSAWTVGRIFMFLFWVKRSSRRLQKLVKLICYWLRWARSGSSRIKKNYWTMWLSDLHCSVFTLIYFYVIFKTGNYAIIHDNLSNGTQYSIPLSKPSLKPEITTKLLSTHWNNLDRTINRLISCDRFVNKLYIYCCRVWQFNRMYSSSVSFRFIPRRCES